MDLDPSLGQPAPLVPAAPDRRSGRLSTEARVVVFALLLVLLAAGMGFFGVVSGAAYLDAVGRHDRASFRLQSLERMLTETRLTDAALWSYLATGDRRFYQSFLEAVQALSDNQTILRTEYRGSLAQSRLEAVIALQERLLTEARRRLDQGGRLQPPLVLSPGGEDEVLLRREIAVLVQTEQREFETAGQQIKELESTGKLSYLVAWVASLVMALLTSLALIRDLREKRRLHSELHHESRHDPLTGLPNRRFFMDRLGRSLMDARRAGGRLALLYLDLDDFKPINDLRGHDAGDEVLRQTARRMKEAARDSDFIARIGGDEFAVIIPVGPDKPEVPSLVSRLVEAVEQPLEGLGSTVGASVGWAMFPHDAADLDGLVRVADQRMYQVKALRKEPVGSKS